MAGVGGSLNIGQGMSREKIGWKLGSGVCGSAIDACRKRREEPSPLGDTRISLKKKLTPLLPPAATRPRCLHDG